MFQNTLRLGRHSSSVSVLIMHQNSSNLAKHWCIIFDTLLFATKQTTIPPLFKSIPKILLPCQTKACVLLIYNSTNGLIDNIEVGKEHTSFETITAVSSEKIDANNPRRLGSGISSEQNLCPQALQVQRYGLSFMRLVIGIIIYFMWAYSNQCEFLLFILHFQRHFTIRPKHGVYGNAFNIRSKIQSDFFVYRNFKIINAVFFASFDKAFCAFSLPAVKCQLSGIHTTNKTMNFLDDLSRYGVLQFSLGGINDKLLQMVHPRRFSSWGQSF